MCPCSDVFELGITSSTSSQSTDIKSWNTVYASSSTYDQTQFTSAFEEAL